MGKKAESGGKAEVPRGIREELENNLIGNLKVLKIYAELARKGDKRYWESYVRMINSFYRMINSNDEFIRRYLKKGPIFK